MTRILVTGATGYVGARLVPALLDAGHTVRVLTRSADRIADREWVDRVEVVEGDADSRRSLDEALADVDVAYYLLHSMDGKADFAERDAALAHGFGLAAQRAGVGRLVYLSGLHPEGKLSEHLASRVEVGHLLMASGVPTIVLQAAIILGSGSASFEMLRHLTHRLPVMLTPKWVHNRIQPIAISDVLDLLVAAATLPGELNRSFDIGCAEVVTYRELIHRYAAAAGLPRRAIVSAPVLTPKLASGWVSLVTPVPSGVAKPLVGSLVHEVVCREDDLSALVGRPRSAYVGIDEAIARALEGSTPAEGRSARPEPGVGVPEQLTAADPDWAGGKDER
jgi:uncharacterized protein YbjT (DUF2867 family)